MANPPHSDARPHVFMEISIASKRIGVMTFELFSDVIPKTTLNFKTLCTGEKIGLDNKPLSYQGNIFHRVIPGFMIQGGDITRRNGTGGESIYGETFPDENFALRHSEVGMLSMANCGPHTNNSQFFITLVPTPHLDGKHCVFGRIVQGKDVLKQISECRTDSTDKPIAPVTITRCGDFKILTEEDEEKKRQEEEEEARKAKEKAEEEQRKKDALAVASVQSVKDGVQMGLQQMKKRKETEAQPQSNNKKGFVMSALSESEDDESGSGSSSNEEEEDA